MSSLLKNHGVFKSNVFSHCFPRKRKSTYRNSVSAWLLKWTSQGLNLGPPDYESVALTNWATSPACQQGCDKFCGAKVRIMSEMCKFFSLNLKKWILVVLSNVPFHGTFSRHGKAQASLALLIWLNENVLLVLPLFVMNVLLFPSSLLVPYASKLFVMCFLLFCNTYYLHIFSSNRTFAPYCPSIGLDKGIER